MSSTHTLKKQLAELNQRVNNLEDIMGIYNGKEKHQWFYDYIYPLSILFQWSINDCLIAT